MQGELSRLCTVPYLWTTVIDHLSFLHTSYIWWVHAICPESSLSPVQLSPLDAPTTAITDGRHRSRVTVERSGWGEEDVQGKHTTTLYPMTIDPPYCHSHGAVTSYLCTINSILIGTYRSMGNSAVLLLVMHSFVSFGWLKLGYLLYNVPKFYIQCDYKQ